MKTIWTRASAGKPCGNTHIKPRAASKVNSKRLPVQSSNSLDAANSISFFFIWKKQTLCFCARQWLVGAQQAHKIKTDIHAMPVIF
jgi:hypothetical protein